MTLSEERLLRRVHLLLRKRMREQDLSYRDVCMAKGAENHLACSTLARALGTPGWRSTTAPATGVHPHNMTLLALLHVAEHMNCELLIGVRPLAPALQTSETPHET